MAGLFVDSNLLLLLIVGRSGKDIIAKHKRLRRFTARDYDTLARLVAGVEQVFVTPHTLTETSNLLAQHKDPERSRLIAQLQHLIHGSKEVAVAATVAAKNPAFRRLGITDAALLEVVSPEAPLLTVDLDLYRQAASKEPAAAVNFNSLREF